MDWRSSEDRPPCSRRGACESWGRWRSAKLADPTVCPLPLRVASLFPSCAVSAEFVAAKDAFLLNNFSFDLLDAKRSLIGTEPCCTPRWRTKPIILLEMHSVTLDVGLHATMVELPKVGGGCKFDNHFERQGPQQVVSRRRKVADRVCCQVPDETVRSIPKRSLDSFQEPEEGAERHPLVRRLIERGRNPPYFDKRPRTSFPDPRD